MFLMLDLVYIFPYFLAVWFLLYINMKGAKSGIISLKVALFIILPKWLTGIWYDESAPGYPPFLTNVLTWVVTILIIVTITRMILRLILKAADAASEKRKR